MFPVFALSQGTEQEAPKTADGEVIAEAEAPQTTEAVELSEEQKKYNRCVADLLFSVYSNTSKCIIFVPRDVEGNLDINKAAPCFNIAAAVTKKIIPACEPLLDPKPNKEPPAQTPPQETTQTEPEKIQANLSDEQKKYDICVAHLLAAVFNGTYSCISAPPPNTESEENNITQEDICFNKTAKAVKNIFPSCEPLLDSKPNEEPAEQQTEQQNK